MVLLECVFVLVLDSATPACRLSLLEVLDSVSLALENAESMFFEAAASLVKLLDVELQFNINKDLLFFGLNSLKPRCDMIDLRTVVGTG